LVVSFGEAIRKPCRTPVTEWLQFLLKVDRRSYLLSDYYNILMRPSGIDDGIYVHLTEGHRPFGALMLFRGPQEPAFSPREYAMREALRGFIAHALRGGTCEESFLDTEDRAIIIADHAGRVLHLSPDGHRLLLMALVPRWAPSAAARMRLDSLPEIAHLCQTLCAACVDALPRAPPVLRRRNGWGEFVLRAYSLSPTNLEAMPGLIGIIVERREALRKIELLDLTAREKELSLLLARGHDTADAVQAMGVSKSTVITHRRSLYHKLGVESRSALIGRLHAGP
jgi:DNA-binding CsgD family transcriptional regulator